jgi:hypothetical protein
MKPPLTAEQIARLIGPQPKVPKINPTPKKQIGWSAMTDEEKRKIIEFKRKNPSYSLDELSKKFDRSKSVIWNLLEEWQGKWKKRPFANIDSHRRRQHNE